MVRASDAPGVTISWKRTHDGRSLRLLVMIDESTRECLSIRVARRLNSAHVIELLGDCMLVYGVPEHVRSDDGAEMTARFTTQCGRTVRWYIERRRR